jgi:[acyl-carrier-protein] S-malonyltransferase
MKRSVTIREIVCNPAASSGRRRTASSQPELFALSKGTIIGRRDKEQNQGEHLIPSSDESISHPLGRIEPITRSIGSNDEPHMTKSKPGIALLFSGQGAQVVGMGKDLADRFPAAAELFQRADEVLGRKLTDIMWSGPIEKLTETANCQPALYVHGLVCLRVLREVAGDFPIAAAGGLSLGEWTAHAAAGTFSFEEGLRLMQKRGALMQAACEATDGAMAAMMGADESAVRQLASATDVDVANINSPGQIVISGERTKVELAIGLAREHGIRRAQLLNVAGAYHSRLMDSVYVQLGPALLEATLQKPAFPVISNVTGEIADTLPDIRRTLQDQVTATVRWIDCVEKMFSLGCDLFVELGPGGVLAGLLQRIRKGTEVISAGDLPSIELAAARIRACTGS